MRVADLGRGTSQRDGFARLIGRSVLIATPSQLTSALALIELDGVARRITILPPDVNRAHLGALIADAESDAVGIDNEVQRASYDLPVCAVCSPNITPLEQAQPAAVHSEWVLLTSGLRRHIALRCQPRANRCAAPECEGILPVSHGMVIVGLYLQRATVFHVLDWPLRYRRLLPWSLSTVQKPKCSR